MSQELQVEVARLRQAAQFAAGKAQAMREELTNARRYDRSGTARRRVAGQGGQRLRRVVGGVETRRRDGDRCVGGVRNKPRASRYSLRDAGYGEPERAHGVDGIGSAVNNGNRYRVDLEQLDDAVAKMEKFGSTVQDWLGELDRHIAELHLAWSSEAATAQRAAHDKWVAGVNEMRENLYELREVARKAHQNYSAAIETNTRMWP